jgi:hypothetical protein
MLTPEFKKRLERTHTFLAALWIILLAAALISALLPAGLFHPLPIEEDYPYLQGLDELIWALAIGTALLLVWSRSRFYNVAAIFEASRRPSMIPVLGDSPAEMGASRVVYFYRSKMLSGLAMAGSIAFYGLCLAVIDPADYQWRLFGLTAAALLVLFYPSKTFFAELIKEYERRETMREWR